MTGTGTMHVMISKVIIGNTAHQRVALHINGRHIPV